MKLILFLCCLSAIAGSPVFPPNFVAIYTDRVDPLNNDSTKYTAFVDTNTQQARIYDDLGNNYHLVDDPIMGDHGVLLYLPKNGDCWYETGPFVIHGPFPSHWFSAANITIRSFINLNVPYTLVYSGTRMVDNILVDIWNSVEQCILRKWNYGPIQCVSYMTKTGTTIPYKYILAHQAKTSFDNDSYFERVFIDFTTDVRDDDFKVPDYWFLYCYNYNNAIDIQPHRGFACSPQMNDSCIIALATRPIDQLGEVYVTLMATPDWYYNCSNCAYLVPSFIKFDSTNWNVPIKIDIVFQNEGLTRFTTISYGGGYDRTTYITSFIVHSQE